MGCSLSTRGAQRGSGRGSHGDGGRGASVLPVRHSEEGGKGEADSGAPGQVFELFPFSVFPFLVQQTSVI